MPGPRPRSTIEHDGAICTFLTWTSAMQCWSWSLPAGRSGSCPMSTEDDRTSVCGHCYAQQGHYSRTAVLNAQNLRLAWTRHLLATAPRYWVDRMVQVIYAHTMGRTERYRYFRVHDSGDFFSIPYINMWWLICWELSDVRFWFPTRAHVFPAWLAALRKLNELPNVSVRPSSMRFDEPAPAVDGLDAGLRVTSQRNLRHYTCPKSRMHTDCVTESCRKCWTATKTEITFLLHGYPLSDHNLNHRRTALTLKGERTPEELSHWREAEHAHDLKQDNRYNEDDPHDP